LRIIIVRVHIGAMKIYVTTLEACRRKERGGRWDEVRSPQKLMVF
jgi:hypothetical protein